ncbi:acyltransferase [Psychrobacillus phage PVJ1]|nr:acyltransferase [Psychrobacillus phage PVJ1]
MNNKLNSIQIFRGIAALLVLFYHFGSEFTRHTDYEFLGGIFEFGYSGVDFFFVLSGFIITYSFLNEKVKKGISVYLKKRLIRVYPVYWIVTILLIPLYFIVSSIGVDYQRDPIYLVKSLLLVPQEQPPLLSVGWTLTHEIKFYILFGLFMVLKSKYLKYLGVLWIIFTALFALNILEAKTILVDFIFSSYNFEFLFGVVCAIVVMRGSSFLPYISIGVLSYFGLGFAEAIGGLEIESSRVLAYGIPSAILILGLARFDIAKERKPYSLLVLLGDASYSIYLIHLPLANILNRGLSFTSGITQAYIFEFTIIIFTIFAGVIFHVLIEKPLLKYLRNLFFSKKATVEKTIPIND